MAKTKLLLRAILIAFLVGGVIFGAALAASSATLSHYQVDFIEVTGQAGQADARVWTYAITADGDEDAALNEWTLSFDNSCGYKIFSPMSSPAGVRSYTTPDSYVLQNGPHAGSDVCSGAPYSCATAHYEVVSNVIDHVTDQRSVTFKNADTPLSAGNPVTHIFRIEIRNQTEHRIGDTAVIVTAGETGVESGVISGPVCPPTAVQLVHLKASSNPASLPLVLMVSASLAALGLTGAFIRRKRA